LLAYVNARVCGSFAAEAWPLRSFIYKYYFNRPMFYGWSVSWYTLPCDMIMNDW
jgi:hypothetical protein